MLNLLCNYSVWSTSASINTNKINTVRAKTQRKLLQADVSTEVMLRHSDTRWKCKAPLRLEAESWGWRWHAESEEWARKGGVQVAEVRDSQHNETKECSRAQHNKHC